VPAAQADGVRRYWSSASDLAVAEHDLRRAGGAVNSVMGIVAEAVRKMLENLHVLAPSGPLAFFPFGAAGALALRTPETRDV